MSILLSSNFQWVLLSTLLLGMAAGLIVCMAHWKRQSLMSDALIACCSSRCGYRLHNLPRKELFCFDCWC